MLNGIKNKVEAELCAYAAALTKTRRLRSISPLLHTAISDFILRPGKRIRPTLFVLGYLAYSRRPAPGLYKSAISIELLHDFMLIHDDIIDKSALRRGRPAMHAVLQAHFKNSKEIKFSGQDLAIVAGDILYALAVEAFLSIKEKPQRKEAALKKFIAAALYTGCGEFIEFTTGARPLKKIRASDIFRVYDLKTAYYSFAYPLSIGATLAGAPERQVQKLFQYGVYFGRAFQIMDDILGMFAEEGQTGKSALSDLKEAKRTLLIWHAFKHASPRQRSEIERLLVKRTIGSNDLLAMRVLLMNAGALDYCRSQILCLTEKATEIKESLAIPRKFHELLNNLQSTILS